MGFIRTVSVLLTLGLALLGPGIVIGQFAPYEVFTLGHTPEGGLTDGSCYLPDCSLTAFQYSGLYFVWSIAFWVGLILAGAICWGVYDTIKYKLWKYY